MILNLLVIIYIYFLIEIMKLRNLILKKYIKFL